MASRLNGGIDELAPEAPPFLPNEPFGSPLRWELNGTGLGLRVPLWPRAGE